MKRLHSAPLHADVDLESLVVPTQFSHWLQGRKAGSRLFIVLFINLSIFFINSVQYFILQSYHRQKWPIQPSDQESEDTF